MNRARIDGWLKEWGSVWSVPELPERVQIEPNKRIRRSLGRCHMLDGKVQIHPGLLDAPEELLREVVCHEAAHVATHLLHGPTVRPHGKEWGQLMRLAGFEARARMDPRRLPESFRQQVQPRVLYRHRCAVCGASREALRPVRRWRCRKHGQLEITRVPLSKSAQT